MIRILYNAMTLDEFEAGQRLTASKSKGALYLRELGNYLTTPATSAYTGRPKKTEIYAEQRGIKGRCLRSH